MGSVAAPLYRYCPHCATELGIKKDGDGRDRQACGNCRWVYYPHAAISSAGILIDAGRVLLVQRKAEPFAGTWHLPSGFVDYGEHPAAAAEREFFEETGLKTNAERLIESFISDDDPREPGHLALFYEMTEPAGTVYNDGLESLGIDWFDITDLPVIALKNHHAALVSYLKIRNSAS